MQFDRKNNMARRPGILAANACFLLGGAGLVLLGELSTPIIMAIYSVFGDISQPAALLWVDALYYLPFILLPCVCIAHRHGLSALYLENVPPGNALMSVLAALVCMPVVNSLTIVWSVLLESLGLTLQETVVIMENSGDLVAAIFAMAVLPGICEEMLFRGVMLGAYRPDGYRKALIISSLMFASLHGSVQGFPGQLLMGFVLGHVVLKSGSIYTGMMLHTAYNSLLIMITYVQQRMPLNEFASGGTILETLGAAGFAAVVVEGALLSAILYALMRFFSRSNAVRTANGVGNGSEITEEKPVETAERPVKTAKYGTAEFLVLISGVVTVAYLYLNDILYMLGYL